MITYEQAFIWGVVIFFYSLLFGITIGQIQSEKTTKAPE